MKVALVCIAKNEENYIEEWVQYNLKLGFDQIFIYENDWRLDKNFTYVTKIPFDGKKMQVNAYNNFIKNYCGEFDWVAFFDVDEFLVLKKHNNIKEFLSDYKDFNGVGINWYFFGSNGLDNINGNYNVIERFTKRQKDVNLHIKSIIKLDRSIRMGVHEPLNVSVVNTQKNYSPYCDNTIAQINHYFTKSKEEFGLKIKRGRADNDEYRTFDEFYAHDRNEVEDLLALNFFKNTNL